MDNNQYLEVLPGPEVTTPSSKSRLPLIFLGILLLILFGIGSFYLDHQSQIAKNQLVPTMSVAAPTIPVQPSPTPYVYTEKNRSESTNWKTYNNSGIGFHFKYPFDWELYYFDESKDVVAFGPQKLIETNRQRSDNPNFGALIGGKAWPVKVDIESTNGYFAYPMEAFISDSAKIVEEQMVVVDKISVKKYILKYKTDIPYIRSGDIITIIFLELKGKKIAISLNDNQYNEIFNQILSTFTFLDQNPTVTFQ